MRIDLQNRPGLSRLAQIMLLVAFWQAGEEIARVTHASVPGPIVGMLLVLCLLATGKVGISSLRRGAEWFLAEMLLFFVPAVLAVLDHREFIGLIGLKIIAVILLGTIIVMSVTALAIDIGYRLMMRREGPRHVLR
ncbi:CidA/LrgA family protein [Rhizobium calliandrae]|uniref:CidA/LrgA family protein n=2 Tax=Rhizobium calliandrae TaxID=1312182 RepID=A0ABT7KDQ9_9HYPH|nr:CidA/LrgA family protein [Rhizobium calliandrae]MDL2406756.1 CidA/LrgA family protein [Rhizobium calliandrae]